MADLTIGEVKKVFQANLYFVDETQQPPQNAPLDLTDATGVLLSWVITNPEQGPAAPTSSEEMQIVDAVNGIVQYSFQAGDLVKPANMGKYGQFRFSIKTTFSDGTVLSSNNDGRLTIKDDSVL